MLESELAYVVKPALALQCNAELCPFWKGRCGAPVMNASCWLSIVKWGLQLSLEGGWPLVIEVPKNNEKWACAINLLHIETLEHTHSNFQVARCRAASQWVVQVVDSRFRLLMVDTCCWWRVWVINGWCRSGRWVVWVWLLGSCWACWSGCWSSLDSLVIIGLSLGATHRWAVLLALGMVMVLVGPLWLSSPL